MTSLSTKTVENYGIEVNDGVLWHGWEPGGEYTKQITLKNVQVKTQKIIYKVPNTRFFTTLYPKPVTLTCGTSFTLPVTFRPLEKGQYEDKIEFHTKDGNFAVPIRAVLPKVTLVVPESLTFGMCAVKDTAEISFRLMNPSEVLTSFKWIFKEPFILSPSSGTLAPKTSCQMKATFSPKGGFVYNATAVCQFGDHSDLMEKFLKLEGIGKYPYLMVKLPGDSNQTKRSNIPGETLLEFGDVAVGSTVGRSIQLQNMSPVNASYQVIHPSSISNLDKVFSCTQYHGVVAPESTTKIKVLYKPSCPGVTHVDYFEINVLGAENPSVIKCVGRGKGPRVALECSSVGFGLVKSGFVVTKVINIVNNSDGTTAFQFLVDKDNSVFLFETTCGNLERKATRNIVVKFRPVLPISYYRKITCLVQNHEPLTLELFGTCHTELTKPAVLQQKHVDQYKVYLQRGLSRISPDQLNEMLNEGKIKVDENGLLANPMGTTEEASLASEEEFQNMTQEEAFFDDPSVGEAVFVAPHVSLDHHLLNFGKCPSIVTVEQKTVNITNHTKGKITCHWMKESEGVFTVSPENADILPLKTTSFTVTFRPNKENQFFGSEVECFVSYKSTRDYRLVEDKTLCPPWCATIYCSGETFTPDRESFLPRVEFDNKQLVFPAVTLNGTSYRTLLITNRSSNPVRFSFNRDPTGAFRCKPSQGMIKEGLQLIMFRYEAVENRTHKLPLCCQLNNEEKFKQEFVLIGSSELPKLHFEDKGTLYFRPTCIGNATKRPFKVQNRSRIPVSFEWNVGDRDSTTIQIEPPRGTILPGEHQTHTWSFCPAEEKKYLIKCRLFVSVEKSVAEPKNVSPAHPYLLRAVGTGVIGKLACANSSLDFGPVTVGTSTTKKITLCNSTDCDLSYHLILIHDDKNQDEEHAIDLDQPRDAIIPARTNMSILVNAHPWNRAKYTTKINYQLTLLQGGTETQSELESSPLCSATVEGVYPTLTVQDIRAIGSGASYSKVQLWNLFSVDSFNSCLSSDPLPAELTYFPATRYSTRRRAPVFTRAVINVSFGSAPCGSEQCVIYLSLLNSGSVGADWKFLFPNDIHFELEYWAETGEYSSEELHEMQTEGHHLFSVEPKSGVLVPGEAQTVVFKYRHNVVGINKLPILFKISRGREVLLNFSGITVETKQPFVHFNSSSHMFAPVPVGLSTPPVQDYSLYNGGSESASYEIDLSPLQALREANYECEILTCLNPTGTIAPGKTTFVQWVFAPLEAKTYIIDIPVRILGCETNVITFTGIGYDQRIMGKTMSLSRSVIDIPTRPVASVESQLGTLSEERVQFGCVPLFTKSRRVIFLSNNLSDHSISFRWLLENSPAENVVEIRPSFGIIKPQGSAVIKISFYSSGSPTLHDMDILCEVTDDTLTEEYNRKLQEWCQAQEERKHTFTITEKDVLEEKQKKQKKKSVSESMRRLTKSEGDIKKFTTLPPIGSAKTPSPATVEDERKKNNTTPDIVVPPKPFLIHLSVTAQTLEVGDVQIDHSISSLTSSIMRKHTLRKLPKDHEEHRATSSLQELRVVTEVLSVILRGLLDDQNFHADIKSLDEEPIPYFRQLPGAMTQRREDNLFNGERKGDLMYSDSQSNQFQEIPVDTMIPETAISETLVRKDQVPSQSYYEIMQHRTDPRNEIRSSAEFASLAEEVMENTILNLLWEASLGEVNITTRPRIIALPPSRRKNKL